MQCYKKAGPRTAILLPNGDAVKFDTVDGLTGYYATDDASRIAVFDRCIAEGRGGLTAIDQAEFETFSKKKQQSPPYVERLERESITASTIPDTARFTPRVVPEPTAVAVDTGRPAEEPKQVKKPRVGKRLSLE